MGKSPDMMTTEELAARLRRGGKHALKVADAAADRMDEMTGLMIMSATALKFARSKLEKLALPCDDPSCEACHPRADAKAPKYDA
jgi:hypothetical protein